MNEMDPEARAWIDRYAAALSVDPPTPEEMDQLLGLAATAAHASHRQAAPVACFLAARSGRSPAEAAAAAEGLA